MIGCVPRSVGWSVGRLVGLSGNTFVRRSTRRTLLAYLALFFFQKIMRAHDRSCSKTMRFWLFGNGVHDLTTKAILPIHDFAESVFRDGKLLAIFSLQKIREHSGSCLANDH